LSDRDALLRSIRLAARPIVLIDGGSGSGKTTIAPGIAQAIDAQLVRLDDLYPGWDGLAAGSRLVHDLVLSNQPRWQRWDWSADAPAEWHHLDPARALVIEGSGALSRANRRRATFGIWVELDAGTRKLRALERDGDAYAPHWDDWAAQEARFAETEHPRQLADLVIDGNDLPELG
jgi:uridine kinase